MDPGSIYSSIRLRLLLLSLFRLCLFSNLVLLTRCETPVCVSDVTGNNVVSLANVGVLAVRLVESNVSDGCLHRSHGAMQLFEAEHVCVRSKTRDIFLHVGQSQR